MKAKKVSENFKRETNPAKSLKLGLYHDNPMEDLVDLAEKSMNAPTEMNFKDWSKLAYQARNEFALMILKTALRYEFGVRDIKSVEHIYGGIEHHMKIANVNFVFLQSSSSSTWRLWFFKEPGKQNHLKIFHKFSTLADEIRKTIKQYGDVNYNFKK